MARRSRGECFVAVAGARGYTCCWPGSAGQDPVLVGHRAGAEGYGHLAGGLGDIEGRAAEYGGREAAGRGADRRFGLDERI